MIANRKLFMKQITSYHHLLKLTSGNFCEYDKILSFGKTIFLVTKWCALYWSGRCAIVLKKA